MSTQSKNYPNNNEPDPMPFAMNIRLAKVEDVISMQHCNLLCLAENYKIKYYYYNILSWPQLSYVAENDKGSCVGYVLSKMGDEASKEGNIMSLAVKRGYRQSGLARRLMNISMEAMVDCFQAQCVYLHVRKSNHVAYDLYSSLEFKPTQVEPKYYEDGEDAYLMQKIFRPIVTEMERKEKDRKEKERNEFTLVKKIKYR